VTDEPATDEPDDSAAEVEPFVPESPDVEAPVPEPEVEAPVHFDRSLRPLDPRAVTLWRIGGALAMLFWGPILFVPVFAVDAIMNMGEYHWFTDIAIASALATVQAVIRIAVFPPLRYRWWRFQLTDEHLFLQRGLLVVRRTMIPLVRVQNVDTVQGPIARRFGLWSVVVFTAANAQSIPALSEAEADALRTTIAELARRARDED